MNKPINNINYYDSYNNYSAPISVVGNNDNQINGSFNQYNNNNNNQEIIYTINSTNEYIKENNNLNIHNNVTKYNNTKFNEYDSTMNEISNNDNNNLNENKESQGIII